MYQSKTNKEGVEIVQRGHNPFYLQILMIPTTVFECEQNMIEHEITSNICNNFYSNVWMIYIDFPMRDFDIYDYIQSI